MVWGRVSLCLRPVAARGWTRCSQDGPGGLRPALPVWEALWLSNFRVEPIWSVCPPGTLARFSQVPKCTPGPSLLGGRQLGLS